MNLDTSNWEIKYEVKCQGHRERKCKSRFVRMYSISETVRDRGLVPEHHQYEMAYGASNGHVTDDVTWPRFPVGHFLLYWWYFEIYRLSVVTFALGRTVQPQYITSQTDDRRIGTDSTGASAPVLVKELGQRSPFDPVTFRESTMVLL